MINLKLIYNPSAGMQTQQDKAFLIARKLTESGDFRVSIFATKKKDDAYSEAKKSCEDGFDIILACGGDGTVNEVVNGIMRSESKHKSKLAILAAGSVNDFSEYLNLPTDVTKYTEMIIRGSSISADVGKANDKYFINVSAGGAFTNIAHEVPVDTKTILGKFAYYLQGAIELPYQLDKQFPVNIKIDEEEPFNADIFLFLITNSPSVGGFKKLVPEASINDNMLDLLIIKKTNKKELVEIFSKIITGQHIKHPGIIYKKASKIFLTSSVDNLILDIDGEQGEKPPVLFEIIPGGIEIIV